MNRFLQRLPRLGYRAKVAMLLVCGVVVGLGGLFLYLLRFHTYLGDDPSACVNCHIMTPYYATWMHGAHARNTTCNDCHVPHDNVFRKYFFKGKDGMNHVYKFVTRQERQAIQAIDESAEVIMENCVLLPRHPQYRACQHGAHHLHGRQVRRRESLLGLPPRRGPRQDELPLLDPRGRSTPARLASARLAAEDAELSILTTQA